MPKTRRAFHVRSQFTTPEMPQVPNANPSKLAMAKLSEKDAWQRYAEAKGDNWPEAFAKWVEARDASLAAWADEVSSRHR
jgi:hypothetical protein